MQRNNKRGRVSDDCAVRHIIDAVAELDMLDYAAVDLGKQHVKRLRYCRQSRSSRCLTTINPPLLRQSSADSLIHFQPPISSVTPRKRPEAKRRDKASSGDGSKAASSDAIKEDHVAVMSEVAINKQSNGKLVA